jgi:hypothetical protein
MTASDENVNVLLNRYDWRSHKYIKYNLGLGQRKFIITEKI